MDQYNVPMEKYLIEFRSIGADKLPMELDKILETGFIEKSGGVFFRNFFTESVASILATGSYFDLSGLEFTTNKIHVEDYCNESNEFKSAIIFIKAFSERWQQKFPNKVCIAWISFQTDSEFGNIATFSFYVERSGQDVIDVNKLSEFENPIFSSE